MKTGKLVRASVEQRYKCDKHNESAQLEPLNNGYYKCHCGWTNQPKVKA